MKIIINFNDKTYKVLNKPSGQKIAGLNTVQLDKGGVCKVQYNTEYDNSFEFDSSKDFNDKIKPCMERELVKDFNNVTK